APTSTETVTLLCDVEIRSTDTPCSRKHAKASARNPTWCHMSIDSIEISVMPLRCEIALSCAASSPGAFEITVPSHSGRSEEHTSELQSREKLVCRLLLEKKKNDAETQH